MNVDGLLLALYILSGAASIGYLMLRASWPAVRALRERAKLAYSVLAGVSFGALVIAAGLLLETAISIPFEKTFLYLLAFAFFASFLALNVYRKLKPRKKIRVVVPVDYISAGAVAKRAFRKLKNKKRKKGRK
ncbi:MAG: hypothetical protein J4415_00465 [Candidatus Diapherotrites archaeon]|uniref:Uncharacterized protein n=1 Tax=Candidatus Iainarchaeum sp. TaxID=3101447 RepID=A0A8T4KU62_9ARCH|nr:hypothetical protein [Candidatus Diapherotrites archaeon]